MIIPLKIARKYAEQIVEQIAPFCQRVEIAGSIRRQRPAVNDIDLVVIAKDWNGLQRRCLERCRSITHGDAIFSVETPTGVQIDIFAAHAGHQDLLAQVPSNWGSVLLQRTGSKEHNIALVQRAKELGLKWCLMTGVVDENYKILAAETEQEIFKALQMDFIAPERRER